MWKMHQIMVLRGVAYSVHGSFLLIFAGLGFFALRAPNGAAAVAFAQAYLLINICILMHELGHVVFGRAVGLHVHSVAITPLGCVAMFDDEGDVRPSAEAVMSAGGPLVTLAICAALFAFNGGINWSLQDASILDMVLLGNIPVLLFNLLPVYPLDGGALVNALARSLFSKEAAQRVSRAFSQGTALGIAAIAAAFGAWIVFALALFGFVLGPRLLAARK
jgi:Zn-dependent protease